MGQSLLTVTLRAGCTGVSRGNQSHSAGELAVIVCCAVPGRNLYALPVHQPQHATLCASSGCDKFWLQ
jgi:hypothetical protein